MPGSTTLVVDYEFVDSILVIYISKGIIALTPNEVKIGLKRGKRFRRRTKLEMRLAAQLGDSGFHQAPQAVDHASSALGGREIFSNRKQVTTRAKEGDVTPLAIGVPHVQLVIDPPTAHLLVDVMAGEISPTGDISPAGYTPSDTGGCTDVTPAA